MYHLVLISMILALSYLAWNLVQFSPRTLSMLLSRKLLTIAGGFMMIIGIFSAFWSSYVMQDGESVLASLFLVYLGLWWMLATMSGARGSYSHDVFLKRVSMMMGLLVFALVLPLYVPQARVLAVTYLVELAGGLWVTTNFFSFLDRGR